VCQAAPQHLHHVRSAGDVNVKIPRFQLVHDLFERPDNSSTIAVFGEYDDVAGFAIFRDQQSAPERARHCVLKTLWAGR